MLNRTFAVALVLGLLLALPVESEDFGRDQGIDYFFFQKAEVGAVGIRGAPGAISLEYYRISREGLKVERLKQSEFEKAFVKAKGFKATWPPHLGETPKLVSSQKRQYSMTYEDCVEPEEGGPHCRKFQIEGRDLKLSLDLPVGSSVGTLDELKDQLWIGAQGIGEIGFYPIGVFVYSRASGKRLFSSEEKGLKIVPNLVRVDPYTSHVWIGSDTGVLVFNDGFQLITGCLVSPDGMRCQAGRLPR